MALSCLLVLVGSMAVMARGEDTGSDVSTRPPLTGNPQIDYIWDPNLPRELNGFNMSNYPFYRSLPEKIDFNCDGRHDGFYASVAHQCQVYHHCLSGLRYDFLCANYTAFDQKIFNCHFASEVDCANSPNFYDRNEALYKTTSTTTQAPQVVFVTRDRFPTSGRDERLPVGRPRPRPRPAQKNRRPRPRLPIYYDDYYDYDYNSDYEESLADEDEGQADQNEAEVPVEEAPKPVKPVSQVIRQRPAVQRPHRLHFSNENRPPPRIRPPVPKSGAAKRPASTTTTTTTTPSGVDYEYELEVEEQEPEEVATAAPTPPPTPAPSRKPKVKTTTTTTTTRKPTTATKRRTTTAAPVEYDYYQDEEEEAPTAPPTSPPTRKPKMKAAARPQTAKTTTTTTTTTIAPTEEPEAPSTEEPEESAEAAPVAARRVDQAVPVASAAPEAAASSQELPALPKKPNAALFRRTPPKQRIPGISSRTTTEASAPVQADEPEEVVAEEEVVVTPTTKQRLSPAARRGQARSRPQAEVSAEPEVRRKEGPRTPGIRQRPQNPTDEDFDFRPRPGAFRRGPGSRQGPQAPQVFEEEEEESEADEAVRPSRRPQQRLQFQRSFQAQPEEPEQSAEESHNWSIFRLFPRSLFQRF